jgi:hypothetical protein
MERQRLLESIDESSVSPTEFAPSPARKMGGAGEVTTGAAEVMTEKPHHHRT